MKIIKLSILALCFVSFISCSKEEDPANENFEELIGTWNLTEFEYVGYSIATIEGMTMRTDYSGVAENIEATTTFQKDGKFKSQGKYDVILTGEGMTIPYRDLSYESTGDYTLSGNSIDITNFEGESTPGAIVASSEKEMTIVEISSSRLVLDFTEDITITEEEDEAFISLKGQYIYTR